MRTEGLVPITQRHVVDTRTLREEPFPEDPQARFEAIFAAIGNSEAKCATLLNLPPNYPLTTAELHRAFMESTDEVWDLDYGTTQNYCEDTLMPIGFVARSDVLHYGRTQYSKGYKITEAGLKFGQPIAAFLLAKSPELPYSLEEIFGMTARGNGGKTRGILNRVAILESLYNSSKPGSSLKLAQELGIASAGTGDQLRSLRELGLIEYNAMSSESNGQIPYTFVDQPPPTKIKIIRNEATLTAVIYEIMKEIKTADYQKVAEECKKRLPNRTFETIRVGRILADLARQGLLSSDFAIGGALSNASITDAGKRILEEIIIPIKKSLTEGGEELLAEWRKIPWQEYAPEAIRKHKSGSSHANERSRQEWAAEALRMIIDNPGIRTTEIASRLKTNTGIVLKILLDEGVARKEKDGKASRYYPN